MGTDLTATNANSFISGVISTARIGTNVGSSSTFLRGDNTWQAIIAASAGVDTQVQYNAGGVLAGSSNFTFAASTGTLTATNLAGNASAVQLLNASNLTAGIVPPAYLGPGDSASTFLRGDSSWQIPPLAAPAGPVNAVQFNNNGVFGGTSNLLFNSTATPPTVQLTGTLDAQPVSNTVSLRYRDTGTNIKGGFTYYGTPFGSLAVPYACGRLTLDPNNAASNADITAASIIYYIPCNGAYITLYNSNLADFENIRVPDGGYSLNISVLPSGFMYDLFIQNNLNGTAQLVWSTPWTNSSARAVDLYATAGMSFMGTGLNQNARYVGTFWTTAAGQISDARNYRCLWNAYNQVPRKLSLSNYNPGGGSWTYTNPTSGTIIYRAVNGDNTNAARVYFVMGGDSNHIGMDGVQFVVMDNYMCAYIPTQNCNVHAGVALDMATVNNFSNDIASQIASASGITQLSTLQNRYVLPGNLGIGLHWFTMSESFYNNSGASATVTFYTGGTQMIGWLMG
jgi:hypothetical protein